MRYQGFISQLNRKQVAPAYLFEGEDLYTRRLALRELKKKLISPAREDFNFHLFNAPGASTQVIVETLSLLPLKDDWRLIVLEDADKLIQKDQLIIADYLKRPVDSSCLVCLGEKFDQRKRFYQAFRKKGQIVTFNLPGQREAQALVKEIEEREGKKVSSPALAELLERFQGNLDHLKNEMEKLILFIHPRKIIEREDVVEITGQGKRPEPQLNCGTKNQLSRALTSAPAVPMLARPWDCSRIAFITLPMSRNDSAPVAVIAASISEPSSASDRGSGR